MNIVEILQIHEDQSRNSVPRRFCDGSRILLRIRNVWDPGFLLRGFPYSSCETAGDMQATLPNPDHLRPAKSAKRRLSHHTFSAEHNQDLQPLKFAYIYRDLLRNYPPAIKHSNGKSMTIHTEEFPARPPFLMGFPNNVRDFH